MSPDNCRCSITLSANAGLSIRAGGTCIWIDALHDEKTNDFSTVTEPMLAEMKASEAFTRPDAIVFTHSHRDHYSRRLAEEAARDWPGAKLATPWVPENGQSGPPDTVCFGAGEASVRLIRLPHEGEHYTEVPNYACLITFPAGSAGDHDEGPFSILVLGDTALGCSELLDRLDELGYDVSPEDRPDAKRLDAVIADFPWAAVGRGWKMLDNLIRPSHLLIYHLPFAEDDIKGYRNMTRIVVKRFRNIPDVRIFKEFLQTETLP